jgi:hypothetical protein
VLCEGNAIILNKSFFYLRSVCCCYYVINSDLIFLLFICQNLFEDNQDAQRQWLGEGPWFDLIKKTSTASRVKLKSVV